MNFRDKINQINQRLTALDGELDKASAERIAEIEKEARELTAERERLTREMAEHARNAFDGGTPVETPGSEEETALSKMNRRDKICYMVGCQARGRTLKPDEKRELGKALTTTSSVFVAATEAVDGVNNAGVFIPTNIVLDFLREDGELSPILNDLNITNIPGLTDFIYRKSRDKARAKAEGAEGKDNQMEWGKLTGTKGYLQTIIPVTDEVRALTDFDFGAYIVSQMLQDINDDWVEELLYGSGEEDHVKGMTKSAIPVEKDGYTQGKVTEALIKGIKIIPRKRRRGAKMYVAQDVYDDVLFAVDDNGRFKYPIFNNSKGITDIGTLPIEVDDNLRESEFLIGNIKKFFKLNMLIPLRIETDRRPRRGVTEYVASVFCVTATHPDSIVYGFVKKETKAKGGDQSGT